MPSCLRILIFLTAFLFHLNNDSSKAKGNTIPAATVAASTSEKKHICLIIPTLPWSFGPYQNQMYELSLLLHERGHDVSFLPYTLPESIQPGSYKNWLRLRRVIPKVVPPPEGFKLDHVKSFIVRSRSPPGPLYGPDSMFTSDLNNIAKTHSITMYMFLSDLGRIVPDVPFIVPAVGWIPVHTNIHVGSSEYFNLRAFHSLAILSPTSGREVTRVFKEEADSVAEIRDIPPFVATVPHIIDRERLMKWATKGLERMRLVDPATVSRELRQEKSPQLVFDKGNGQARLPPHPIFSEKKEYTDTFVVLMQNGNYDDFDRKGWDMGLQAFSKFYKRHESDDKMTKKRIHLYVHSMESYNLGKDMNNNAEPPGALKPAGMNLMSRLHSLGLPRSAYTIDYNVHEPEVVAALKRRASVCLHVSKVEGFGMNMLECQALETKVITTNYTAMADYTRWGERVPYRQTVWSGDTSVEMAMVDVDATVDALDRIYDEFRGVGVSADQGGTEQDEYVFKDKALVEKWIDKSFSKEKVDNAFHTLILKAEEVHISRAFMHYKRAEKKVAPTYYEEPMFRLAMGEHSPVVDWKEPWTILAPRGLRIPNLDKLQHELYAWTVINRNDVAVFTVKTVYSDSNGEVPLMDKTGSLHPHYSIFIRTYLVAGMQARLTRRVSLAQKGLEHAMARNTGKIMEKMYFVVDRATLEDHDDTFYNYYGNNDEKEGAGLSAEAYAYSSPGEL